MKILLTGVFGAPGYPRTQATDEAFKAGFEENGCETVILNTRSMVVKEGAEATGLKYIELIEQEKPDLIWSRAGEGLQEKYLIDGEKFNVTHFCWHGDLRLNVDWIKHIIHTNRFYYNEESLLPNFEEFTDVECEYMLEPAHPIFSESLNVPKSIDVLFTGRYMTQDRMRTRMIDAVRKSDFKFALYGCEGNRNVSERLYREEMQKAKIVLGSNEVNWLYKYTSCRLTDVLASGSFYLCQWFPGIEELFTVGLHLDTFRTTKECLEKIDYYLKNEEQRETIAKEGQKYYLENYSAKRTMERVLETWKKLN